MLPIKRFMDVHQITGEVVPADDNPVDRPLAGAAHYRVVLRRDGRSMETRCSRAPGAGAPTVGEALAEMARRAAAGEVDGRAASEAGRDLVDERRQEEAERLREFLGEPLTRELIFEFGHRAPEDIDAGDPVSSPARADEMTNTESEAVDEAREDAATARAGAGSTLAYALGAPLLAMAAGGALLARGRRGAGRVAMLGGAVAGAVAGGVGLWRRRQASGQAEDAELRNLAAERISIETGRT